MSDLGTPDGRIHAFLDVRADQYRSRPDELEHVDQHVSPTEVIRHRLTVTDLRTVLDEREQLLTGIECVLLDHVAELSGPGVDPNLAELAHRFLAVAGDDAPVEIREALARAEELAGLCERCGGNPCTECGECPRQGCRDCRCGQRERDDDEPEDGDDD